ncbi:ribosomal protein S7 [Cutaneotrichosporon oleaginosum]|uniref:Ribosomal protein S7 n=1 Tax=Cutaneotrichosporon oleaginosum TaxID=879819 RepID=A0A0J0XK45_9TREE|nr:ribosomal protein S7 [Cutaneotrichosporon oleaginosum]KLT41473.1 ribosomal protein S7 [Cutaneotrichosporon oleaginosum]
MLLARPLARTPLALDVGLRALSVSSPAPSFADLARITSSPPSSFSVALPPTTSEARGYAPGAMALRADPVLDLFTNMLMRHGKKAEAQRHAASVLAMLQAATNSPPLPQLHRAIELASPSVKLLSMRKRAKTIMTPRALNERQRTRTGIKWLLKAAERGRKGGVRRDDRVAREVLAVLDGSSDVFKRVEEVHKIAMLQRSNINAR